MIATRADTSLTFCVSASQLMDSEDQLLPCARNRTNSDLDQPCELTRPGKPRTNNRIRAKKLQDH